MDVYEDILEKKNNAKKMSRMTYRDVFFGVFQYKHSIILDNKEES